MEPNVETKLLQVEVKALKHALENSGFDLSEVLPDSTIDTLTFNDANRLKRDFRDMARSVGGLRAIG